MKRENKGKKERRRKRQIDANRINKRKKKKCDQEKIKKAKKRIRKEKDGIISC